MGYRIQYEPDLDYKYKMAKEVKLKKVWITGAFVALCILLIAVLPSVRGLIWDFLIPGDPQVTTEAFSTLVSDIRNGENLSDAVTVFCRQIIANG